MAELKSDVVLDAVDVAVDCREQPAGGGDKLHLHIAVVWGPKEVAYVIVEFHKILGGVLSIAVKLW
jgi:hypothetical protein